MAWYIHLDKNHPQQLVMFFLERCKTVFFSLKSTSFEFLDYLIFVVYALVILGLGLWVSRNKEGEEKSAEDYFLAGKSLPWWAIGASLIAANISWWQKP